MLTVRPYSNICMELWIWRFEVGIRYIITPGRRELFLNISLVGNLLSYCCFSICKFDSLRTRNSLSLGL